MNVRSLPPSFSKATVLIVDDHPLIRLGLRALLEPEYRIVGEVQHGRDVIPAIERLQPSVLLLDLSLPGRSGVDVLRELAPNGGPPGVVALTTHQDRGLAELVLRLGARACISKDASLAELRRGIETARSAGPIKSLEVARVTESPLLRYPREYQRLTLREQQVVQMIGLGLTTGRMALQLRVSYRTVHFHRTNIRRKLGFRTEWEMTRFALEVQQCAVLEQRVV